MCLQIYLIRKRFLLSKFKGEQKHLKKYYKMHKIILKILHNDFDIFVELISKSFIRDPVELIKSLIGTSAQIIFLNLVRVILSF